MSTTKTGQDMPSASGLEETRVETAADEPKVTRRVLIVDADRDSRELYAIWFRHNGYDVVEAANGPDALEKAIATPIALLITETWLPQLDGFALCERLRSRPATRTLPILIVTADARSAVLDQACRAGADVVLVKPASPGEVFNHALRVLQRTPINDRQKTELEAGPVSTPPPSSCPECGQPLDHLHSVLHVSADHTEQRHHYSCRRCGRKYHGPTSGKLHETG
jgi:CheY-like chemotaxis protein